MGAHGDGSGRNDPTCTGKNGRFRVGQSTAVMVLSKAPRYNDQSDPPGNRGLWAFATGLVRDPKMKHCLLPIHALVEARLKALGIRRSELARRCGFKNLAKGMRRLDAVCKGDIDSPSSRMILTALPTALDVEEGIVQAAVRETAETLEQMDRTAAADRESAWRASFQPHGYLCGSTERPSSITICGFTGGPERWLKIPLDCSKPPVTFTAQAMAVVRRTPTITFFGRTTGFIINYSPDDAVRFDLRGNPVEVLSRAYSPAQIELQIGRRKVSADRFGRIMGVSPGQRSFPNLD